MTAVSLLDAVKRADTSSGASARAAALAGRLIEASLAEHQRIRELETEFAPGDWTEPRSAIEIERLIYGLHVQWASEAHQVLLRVRQLLAAGVEVPDAESMEDAYASMLARLKLTPEKTAKGLDQANRGEFRPAEELRSELRARIRS